MRTRFQFRSLIPRAVCRRLARLDSQRESRHAAEIETLRSELADRRRAIDRVAASAGAYAAEVALLNRQLAERERLVERLTDQLSEAGSELAQLQIERDAMIETVAALRQSGIAPLTPLTPLTPLDGDLAKIDLDEQHVVPRRPVTISPVETALRAAEGRS